MRSSPSAGPGSRSGCSLGAPTSTPGRPPACALGINFNVAASRTSAVACLLHESGFTLARMGIGWSALSYEDPTRFTNEASILARFRALRRYGLRRLLVLNANSGGRCPAKAITLETTADAPAVASTVRLTPASAAAVAPVRSGFTPGAFFPPPPRRHHHGVPGAALAHLTPVQRRARRAANRAGRTPLLLHGTPDILITRVNRDGVATLSRSTPAALAAGAHPGFPDEYDASALRPVNALGLRDTPSRRSPIPAFIPTYQSLLPEYALTATSTETLIRDLAPLTTRVYGFPHGRRVGSRRAPVQKWITEYNLGASAAPVGPDGHAPATQTTLTQADRDHFHAKALLGSLVAMVSKVQREYFFAAGPGALSLISGDLCASLAAHPKSYPGERSGGQVKDAFRALVAAMRGPGPARATRQLRLVSIAQTGGHAQFAGDGTAADPALYDRDVLAVFPFQTAPRRFVSPVDVMTRDLLTLYRPGSPQADVGRFDLPAERLRTALANLARFGRPPSVSAYDPLSARTTPARVISHRGERAVVEIARTDYPRLLSIELP